MPDHEQEYIVLEIIDLLIKQLNAAKNTKSKPFVDKIILSCLRKLAVVSLTTHYMRFDLEATRRELEDVKADNDALRHIIKANHSSESEE